MSRLRRATRKLLHEPEEDNDIQPEFYDEQEQEKIIHDIELELHSTESFFRSAFTAVMLLPTPLFLVLPYCRVYNSMLSLLSISSIALSVYIINILKPAVPWLFLPLPGFTATEIALTPIEIYVSPLNIVLAAVILAAGLLIHYPWAGFDYIWSLPTISVATAVMLRKWIADTNASVVTLHKTKYPYKGA
ncbi:uncharacterized protein SAPINGB_P001378 [Magnusiomyces paraingens]|uniref:Uncharacterized protein n=1 Tax=Magnusiomyces paraingens TaxID=2606893 RepID=A0A5E8B7J7_9ASCO|nr:uncharacterized protein SAPINGB_P001378 [Saprochaete ingens]VVT46770.1 unnamed protein product [Saprochaete ingens]